MVGDCFCFGDGCLEGYYVFVGVDLLGVPVVGFVVFEDVFVERDRGVVFDRDVVVVIEHDQVVELVVFG